MLFNMTAIVNPGTAQELDSLFSTNIKEYLKRYSKAVGITRDITLEGPLMSDSPNEFVDMFSWNWKTQDNLLGGATGVCTLYLAGEVDPEHLGVTNVEVNNAKGHLSLKIELL